ncbi:hypothetical protein [Nitrobacter vulgaris]|jgi:hypothetical protein|uniref:Uncharacterized protein n=1 Tax=Nitrobacter vulgaris TaxID=29421 RepID=A0A1V4HWZ6_NITVU|nr:hypothetical protein [Nitrobacter vulgaris]OPH82375.1 hypothetical protein B2M20_12360 [Nitrobacter vulgaris]
MSKGSMFAAAAVAALVLAAIAAFVTALVPSRGGLERRAATSPDRNRQWDTYSVSDYYRGEYDWPGLKLGDPATRQSIIHDIVPQIERLTPDQLARLAKQQDFCSGPLAIKCFGIPASKLRGYVEWTLGRHVHDMAVQSSKTVER